MGRPAVSSALGSVRIANIRVYGAALIICTEQDNGACETVTIFCVTGTISDSPFRNEIEQAKQSE